MDNEPLRRIAHEIERIAGDEGKRGYTARFQHVNVSRTNNLDLIHDVCVSLLSHSQVNLISNRDVLQPPEEPVAVPGDSNVSFNSRHRGAGDAPDPSVKSQIVRSVIDRNPDLHLCDLEHCQRRT